MAVEEDDVLNANRRIVITANGSAHGHSTAVADASTRTSFAMSHVASARRFTKMILEVERLHEGKGWGEHWEEAKDYATAALILSFAAVEASINEAMDDLSVPPELYAVLEKASTIGKAQALLAHLGKSSLDASREPVQSIHLLAAIRNFLVHARGEWSNVQGEASRVSKRIVAHGIPLSPFHPDPKWAAERGVMSAGAASWALDAARNFIDAFRDRAGLRPLPLRL